MERFIAGYRRFREGQWPERRAVFEELARQGQAPPAMVIACSDSRVDPAMIFSAGPGELFIVRNVANLVPPYHPDVEPHATSAALEFAVRSLEIGDLIVLGHGMCGGIQALLAGTSGATGDFLGPWMGVAHRAKEVAMRCEPAERQEVCEREAVKLSLENLLTFPWIAERVAAGRLKLHGASFDIRTGILSLLKPDGSFVAA
jgi:carbonic anhydrase